MVRLVRSFVQSILKLVNSVMAMVGLAMILYAVWMIRVWQRHTGELQFGGSDYPAPWVNASLEKLRYERRMLGCWIYVIFPILVHDFWLTGTTICCRHMDYFYMFIVFLLLMLEAAVTVDVFLNHDWEDDFPADATGNFNELKNFVRSNFKICKWIGLSIVCVQGLSLLLAMILKALGPYRYDDSDDDYSPETAPLLKNAVHPPTYVVGDPAYGSR